MAGTSTRRRFYNLIWILLLAVLLLCGCLSNNRLTSLAMEQETRCGIQEHSHTEACYLDGVLLCRQKAHVHSENCYLLLLEDNNINWLLQTVSLTERKSLEAVIDSALVQAVTLNDSFSGQTPPLRLSSQDVSLLNRTIAENNISPAVVLNEDLGTGSTLTYSPGSGGVSVLAVGDSAVTGTRAINFYMLLDGRITFVENATLTNSSPDYYSYQKTAAIYNDVAITGLRTTTIRNPYYFRYNTTGNVSQASSFSTDATYRNSNVRFGSTNSTRYVLLTDQNDNAIPFYTVKLDYSQLGSGTLPQFQYVESGYSSTLTLSEEYLWYDAQGNVVTALPDTITETTTLYARPKAFTATFINRAGAEIAAAYSATPENNRVTVALPSLENTVYKGYYWIVQGSDGTTYYNSDGNVSVDITGDTVFQAVPSQYTVSFVDAAGALTTRQIGYRQTIVLPTLPEGYYWYDNTGLRYDPGISYGPVTENATFTAATRTITVSYDVNFPEDAVSEVDRVPTIYGTTSATATDVIVGGNSVITKALTSRTARDEVSSGNKESQTYFFKGWTVNGFDVLIPPDSTLNWNQLENFADVDGNVSLVGVWEDAGRYNSVTFFVQFASQAVDTDGNITSRPTSDYTPEIFNTHVGGVDTTWTDAQIKAAYEIADTSSDNSVTADREIRALYGEKAEGVWLYDFPKDEDVFQYLINYLENNPSKQLTVDGEAVDPAELDDKHYAIRWYVFKLEGSTWHVDGKLVRKFGTITVDKEFYGNDTAIGLAEDGFYILAENGIKDENGTFTPHASNHEDFRQILLVLDQATANGLASVYPNAEVHIVDTENLTNDNFEWKITDVTLDEHWRVTEYPVEVSNYSYYAEYSIYDTDGAYSAIAEYGTRASVVGKAFALDEDPDQGMLVDFANYYYEQDSILLKKEDAATGRGIDGAVFEFWQNGRALKFHFDPDTYIYSQNPDGTTTQIQTARGGIAVITAFSYQHGDSTGDGLRDGDITIKEILPPSGYDKAPDVELGVNDTNDVILKDVSGVDASQWSKHAAVPDNEVVVIRDHVSEYLSVEVNKVWNTSAPADSVEVVLQANGGNAAALFPGMTNAQITLNTANQWKHTWTDLPRYANGQLVTWGVKEVVVGGMPTLADGVSFANWIVTYSPGQGADTDADGDVDQWTFTVTNATRRPQLILSKVGSDGALLPGAVFTLEQVTRADGTWQSVSGTAMTQTTDSSGMLTFDQLMAGAYYRLTEVQPPGGYISMPDAVILTVNGEGLVQQVHTDGSLSAISHSYITHTGPYNLQILNLRLTPLPETGGMGTGLYTQSGCLLIVLAAAVYIYKIKRRKEGADSS